jgi:hypothetical protein
MGHFVPLAESVDAGAAGFVEAGGVEDPPGNVGVGGISLTPSPSPRGRGEDGDGPSPRGRGEDGGGPSPGGRGRMGSAAGAAIAPPVVEGSLMPQAGASWSSPSPRTRGSTPRPVPNGRREMPLYKAPADALLNIAAGYVLFCAILPAAVARLRGHDVVSCASSLSVCYSAGWNTARCGRGSTRSPKRTPTLGSSSADPLPHCFRFFFSVCHEDRPCHSQGPLPAALTNRSRVRPCHARSWTAVAPGAPASAPQQRQGRGVKHAAGGEAAGDDHA